MQLLLFRHGIAADFAPGGDDLRPLTDEGIRKTRAAAQGLASLVTPPQLILTSPKLRARQTADLLGQVFHRQPQVLPELADAPLGQLLAALHPLCPSSILAVGHEPTLSQLTEQLAFGAPTGVSIDMKKAGCACLQLPDNWTPRRARGILLWLATPRLLRALAGDKD